MQDILYKVHNMVEAAICFVGVLEARIVTELSIRKHFINI